MEWIADFEENDDLDEESQLDRRELRPIPSQLSHPLLILLAMNIKEDQIVLQKVFTQLSTAFTPAPPKSLIGLL